jgi:hypothetical protein
MHQVHQDLRWYPERKMAIGKGWALLLKHLLKNQNAMSVAQSFLQELQAEAKNTRKLVEAISDDILDYNPDFKSWTTADLAAHIIESYH